MNTTCEQEIRFRRFKNLIREPSLSQRELGIRLGKVNYCLAGRVQKGRVKVKNFRESRHKMRCLIY